MISQHEEEGESIQERMAEENRIQERRDQEGNRWHKIYFGGGGHLRNWLEQFKELGDVQVEEVDSRGFKCYEESGEKLVRVWLKMDKESMGDFL